MTAPLPHYPQASAPSASPATLDGDRWVLVLQVLLIVGFWVGLYVLHNQAQAFAAAHKKAVAKAEAKAAEAEAKKIIMGRWQSIRVPGVELELRYGRYKLLRDNTVSHEGKYDWSGDGLKLWTVNGSGIDWSLHCRLAGDELVLRADRSMWGTNRDWILLFNVLGAKAAAKAYAEENVLRFKRMRE
jgi:hypothetical protein